MLKKLLLSSRYLIVLAVLGSLLAATFLILFATFDVLRITFSVLARDLSADSTVKTVSVGAVELIELYLLGTVLYVISLGLYQLFIERDITLPEWLEIKTLDNLKERLLSTILVMLGVSFFGYAVTWDGSWTILAIGVGTGMVIFALAYTIQLGLRPHEERDSGRDTENSD